MEFGGAMNVKFNMDYYNDIPTDLTSLTYSGVFSSSLFEIRKTDKSKILSMDSQAYSINNPLTGNSDIIIENLITSKYDGVGFRSGPIDLSICLDISGSMSGHNLDIAKVTLHRLLEVLQDQDSIALSVFDDSAETVHAMTRRSDINMPAELAMINAISTRGGTNLYSGIARGIELIQQSQALNRRVIFITDMCSVDDPKMEQAIVEASAKGIYTSIIGIGTEFNTQLTEKLAKIRGLNYFSVSDAKELQAIIVEEFQFHFFPNAFDLQLSLKSGNFRLVESIGGGDDIDAFTNDPSEDWTTSSHSLQDKLFKSRVEFLLLLFKYRLKRRLPKPVLANVCNFLKFGEYSVSSISTAFPSKLEERDDRTFVKGGLLLHRLEKLPQSLERMCLLSLKYADIHGAAYTQESLINMDKIPHLTSAPTSAYCLYIYANYMRGVMSARSKDNKEQLQDYYEKADSVKQYLKLGLADKKKTEELCGEVQKMQEKIKKYLENKSTK